MSPPDPLDPILQRWDKVPRPHPSLKAEVWRRIAMAESTPQRQSLWRRIEGAFAHPAFSAAFVACCVLIGLFIAEVRISREQHQHQVELARQYVKLIDPLMGNDEQSARIP